MDWNQLLTGVADSGYVKIGLVVATVLGILLRYWAVRRSRKNRQLRAHSDNVTMIRLEPTETTALALAYKGRRIYNATISTVRVWNSGTEEIRRMDIPATDPLRITVPPEVEVLEFSVAKATREGNKVECAQRAPNVLELSFEFLNPGDGAVIQLLHTGDLESKAELHGDIIGPGGEVRFEAQRRFYIHGMDGSKNYTIIPEGLGNAVGVAILAGLVLLALVGDFFRWSLVPLIAHLVLLVFCVMAILPSRSRVPKALR